jgi:UDP-N-acetylglucosamine transferase subunit ALG13
VIFVTIGSMFPFDRLIRAMDAWAGAHPGTDCLAQIGEGGYLPERMRWVRRLDQADFARAVAGAELVVAHAGMGSVITASQHRRPIVMLPRRLERGEHTTDHQIATANWLRGKPGVHIAEDDADLGPAIAAALAAGPPTEPTFPAEASQDFIARIRRCITDPS